MGLFNSAVKDKIDQVAAKSNEQLQQAASVNTRSMNDDLNKMSKQVVEYFKDSPAILITTKQQLHEYVDKCIETGYAGIDTETTGVDRIKDWIVGASLYTPGMPECYFPMKHIVPIFDTPYKDQLTYEEVAEEFQRLVDNKVKLIFANADFDLAMIYHSLKVDLIPAFYYDVILAWRCIKENELDNALKTLYAKYVMKGKVDPKKFSDFFSPKLFPYCKPKVAALYAANDAKITYELFLWQLPYVTKTHEKCKSRNLEKIADIVWNIEFPMVSACALLHRRGVYLDDSIAKILHARYTEHLHKDEATLAKLVQELIDTKDIATNRNRPFKTGSDFNPNSQPHVKYLVNNLLGSSAKSTDKQVLKEINQPATSAILDVRGDVKLISTYVDKLPKSVDVDHRIHPTFKSVGAATGRMASESPNAQNIPSKAHDIRHMFRATPEQVEILKIDSEADPIVITLSNFDSVFTTHGQVKVKDVKAGDIVKFRENGAPTETEVHCIEPDAGLSKITFKHRIKEAMDNLTIEVIHPPYAMMSSDFSQQEPRLTAAVTMDSKLVDAFRHNRDVYATISSIAMGVPYEECLEFHPVTGELQPEGKARRSIGKVLNLGEPRG